VTDAVFLTAQGADLVPGQVVELDQAEAHHAGAAFRARPGETVEVVNGSGLRGQGVVEAVDGGRVAVAIGQVVAEPPPAVELTLVQALAKHKRDEQAITAATELGIDRVVPWQAERSVVRWQNADKAEVGRARWQALVRAASKVARRAYLPPVEPLVIEAGLVKVLSALGGTTLVLHESAQIPLTAWAASWTTSPSHRINLVVGPEGGLSNGEVEILGALAGSQVVRLGPNVLRTSTAGPAALAVVCALVGRFDH